MFCCHIVHCWCLSVLQPIARKVFAALLVGMSACVVWSSATIFTGGHPDLSPFSLMIRCTFVVQALCEPPPCHASYSGLPTFVMRRPC